MSVVYLLLLVLLQSPPKADAVPVRVWLPLANTLAPDFRDSTNDLSDLLRDKRKTIEIVDDKDRADVEVEVTDRSVTVPRVAIGVVKPGRPGEPAAGLIQVAHLTATVTAGALSVTIKNKNSPTAASDGWKSAADDIARQIDTWIGKHKAELIAARR